jgi:hypothetical protein
MRDKSLYGSSSPLYEDNSILYMIGRAVSPNEKSLSKHLRPVCKMSDASAASAAKAYLPTDK